MLPDSRSMLPPLDHCVIPGAPGSSPAKPRLTLSRAGISVLGAALMTLGCQDAAAPPNTSSATATPTAKVDSSVDEVANQLAQGDAFLQEGDLAAARQHYDAAIAAAPNAPAGYARRAALLARAYQYEQAAEDYTRAIQFDSANASQYLSRALVYQHQGRLDAAMHDANEAVRLDPQAYGGYSYRANLYIVKKDFKNALADSDEAIRRNPEAYPAHHNRGLALAGLGRWADAIGAYGAAIELNKDFAEAYVNRGNAHWQRGDLKAARADFDQTIRIAPDFLMAYENRGTLRGKAGDWAGAAADFTEVLTRLQKEIDKGEGRIRPGERTAKVLLKRAAARLQLKEHQPAIDDATAAIRLTPAWPQAYLVRAAAYDAQGKRAMAAADRERAGQQKR